eukprot:gene8331-9184_t
MAVTNVHKFNWEKILSKVTGGEVKRSFNLLRNKSNEILATHARYAKEVEPINFAAYKNKLRFTSAAVDALEKVYQDKKLPVYTAQTPELELKKRELLLKAADEIVQAVHAELEGLNKQLEAFEKIRITKDTTYEELAERFPHLVRDVEEEIKNHQWFIHKK